ncbi:MAG: 3-methyl-2-oxobutanoate hydroxymethyltransferase [Gemmatimonadota bacterium]|jgi:3-methyl-2-oxobutanoate hydroxymethyltransferase|nr:3-methyl-2-oxobutanoate hydroxymethyltransferase [Gemmatimonadota bacterium]
MSAQSPASGKGVTILDLREMKARGERIAVLTAYDWLFARLVDTSGIDIILVGDSLGQVVLGLDSTVGVTLNDMIHHARAVCRGVSRSMVVVDLPFLTYQLSTEEAVRNAGRVLQESGATAVKLEGGSTRIAGTVERMVEAGIPVMGHLGFTPQSVHTLGGNRVQGRDDESRQRLRDEARRLQDAGAFSIVLELIPGDLAADLSADLRIPTIGIGAGPHCDGQVLVLPDMLGLNREFNPRFLRRFAELGDQAEAALREYVSAVKDGSYPTAEHTFS